MYPWIPWELVLRSLGIRGAQFGNHCCRLVCVRADFGLGF